MSRLKAAAQKMMEEGELTLKRMMEPYTRPQMGVLCLGNTKGVKSVEEMIEQLPAAYWILKGMSGGMSPDWTKEFVLRFIQDPFASIPGALVQGSVGPVQPQERCPNAKASSSQKRAEISRGKKLAPLSPER